MARGDLHRRHRQMKRRKLRWLNHAPEAVWKYEIIPYLNFTEFAQLRCHSSFNKYWQEEVAKNTIRVPQDCPTVEKAMALAMFFNAGLRIVLDNVVHEIVGDEDGLMAVTCSHITFVGKGKDQTTIRGGFRVENQQHVKFEELAAMNQSGHAFYLEGSETNVDMLKCAAKECGDTGMLVCEGATVTATQCEFMYNGSDGVGCDGANTKARLNDCKMHHNGSDGLWASNHAVVDLHGTKTDIHSNNDYGIRASTHAKVNIYSQHNTSHDNDEDDRIDDEGGSIANINADGTFTHV